jgi:hypothetical protein
MSDLKTKCLGLDLTQHRPMMALAEGTKIIEFKILARTPPAALLPIINGESVIAGAAAHEHRRGAGSVWPPECQTPVYGEYLNGVGRIPLVCAWAKLTKPDKGGFSGNIGDTDISWRPTGKRYVSFPSERLITESAIAWEQRYAKKKTAIIVPDSLNEAAQQALIDNFDAFLTPRPIAVALSWCRRNSENFQGEGDKSEEGTTMGHLVVITMALDQWEVVPIEIRAKIFDKKTWLVPVRNRVYEVGRIPRVGAGLFIGISIPSSNDATKIWQFAFGSEKASSFADGEIAIEQEQINALREYIRSGWTDRDRKLFSKWDIWEDLFATSGRMEIDMLKEKIFSLHREQLHYLNNFAAKKCLGVVIDGACARVRITEERQFGDIIASVFESHKIEIGDGFEAVRGAAYTSAALKEGLPCYRETIIPIEIHCHRRNKKGDFENAWKMLIEGTTIKAGSEYKSIMPVEGLQIKQGAKKLELTLRRPSDKDEYIYRKVSAEIQEETREDEPVKISANLRPGQGFAKVTINSVREGIFHTSLNWRTMEPCDSPPPPPLSYLPQISKVTHDEDMWFRAEPALSSAIQALRDDSPDLIDILVQLRNHLNKNPLADSVDEYRGRIPKGDIFRHYGVFPSDGNLNEVQSPGLANEFARECESYFSRAMFKKKKKAVQQTASWLYLACPPEIIESSRQNLKQHTEATSPVDLHTIGLCWERSTDIESFFVALERLFQVRLQGINNWLRAIRNIVRFRDHALKPEVVSLIRLENIISGLLRSLEDQIKGLVDQYGNSQLEIDFIGNSRRQNPNLKRIFDNCVLSILYLLKRRRYEPDFMTSGSEHYKRLDDIFSTLIKRRKNALSKRQFEIVSITQKFLNQEASYDDLKKIIMMEDLPPA